MEREATLQHKLNLAREVHDNIAIPGWINQRAPRATKLRLDGDAIEISRNFLGLNERGEKTGIGVKDLKKSLEKVILKYEQQLASPGDLLREQTRTQDILRTNLTKAPLAEVSAILEGIIQKALIESPDISVLGLYQQAAETLPYFPVVKQQEVLQAIASIDSQTASMGRDVLIWINSKTILNALEPFLTDSQ